MEYGKELAVYAAERKDVCMKNDAIPGNLYQEYGVKRGLRDEQGRGVLAGLTNISAVYFHEGGRRSAHRLRRRTLVPGLQCEESGECLRGKQVTDLRLPRTCCFSENCPPRNSLTNLCGCWALPDSFRLNFTRDVIMKAPSKDIMNSMTRSILTLASYDQNMASNDIDNCIRRRLQLIAEFPMLAAYGYHAYNHYENDQSMYIHKPGQQPVYGGEPAADAPKRYAVHGTGSQGAGCGPDASYGARSSAAITLPLPPGW